MNTSPDQTRPEGRRTAPVPMGRSERAGRRGPIGRLTSMVVNPAAFATRSCRSSRMHGYAIATHIQHVSAELLRVEEGSLYPALHRMEQLGWQRSEWGVTDKDRDARFYFLTAKGRKQLAAEEESWARLTEGVSRVLRYT